MKPTKLAILAAAAALALGADSVKAAVTTTYSKLNIGLTIQQQALYNTNKSGDHITYISTIDTTKLDNKTLLKLLAKMFNTNWPTGAQLEWDWNSQQMIVADKTGSNVLFYCGNGVDDESRYAFVTVDWFNASGPISDKHVYAIPGPYNFTQSFQGHIWIYYLNYGDSSVFINLSGYGLNVENYSQKATATGTTWSDTETFSPVAPGSASNTGSIMTGKITAKGKGKF